MTSCMASLLLSTHTVSLLVQCVAAAIRMTHLARMRSRSQSMTSCTAALLLSMLTVSVPLQFAVVRI